jgi:HEAT repeat protein
MTGWLRTLGEGAGSGETALVVLVWSVIVLTGLSGLLAIAATLLRVAHVRRERRHAVLAATWTPLLLDVLGGSTDAEVLQRTVYRRDRAAFVHLLLQYAFTIRGTERDRLDALAAPHLPALVPLLHHRDAHDRMRAVQALGMLSLDTYAPAVLAALDDRDDLVAMTAAQLLTRRGEPGHAAAVIERLERFERWGLSHVTSMLTDCGPGAAPLLLDVFGDPARPPLARAAAGEALRWLNHLAAADTAAALLATETNVELVAVSLRLLRRLGRADHLGLVRDLCRAPEPVVRIHAVSALAALGGRTEEDALQAAFFDESHWVAIRAARGLREAGHADVLEDLAASPHARADLARQILLEEGG